MKIAVFHDLPSGGAKRALYQYCSCLSSGGHILDAFVPETADENYLPLDDMVTRKLIYPVDSKRILKRLTEKSNILVRFLAFHMDLYYRNRCQKEIADDINKGDYDIAFVHHSAYTQSPFLLRYLSVPSVYFRPGLVIVADRENVREKYFLQQIARDYGVKLA